jgi:hypothetical protein
MRDDNTRFNELDSIIRDWNHLNSEMYCLGEDLGMDFDPDHYSKDFERLDSLESKATTLAAELGREIYFEHNFMCLK